MLRFLRQPRQVFLVYLSLQSQAPRPGAPPEVPPEGPRGATPLKVTQLGLYAKINTLDIGQLNLSDCEICRTLEILATF